MIRSLHWRLQIWHAAILGSVMVLFGIVFYRQLQHAVLGEIDAELVSGARVLEANLRSVPRPGLRRLLDDLPWDAPLFRGRQPGVPPGRFSSGRPDRSGPERDQGDRDPGARGDRNERPRDLGDEHDSRYWREDGDRRVDREERGEARSGDGGSNRRDPTASPPQRGWRNSQAQRVDDHRWDSERFSADSDGDGGGDGRGDRRPPWGRFDVEEPLYWAIFSEGGELLRSVRTDDTIDWSPVSATFEYRTSHSRREVWLRGPFGTTIVVGRDVEGPMSRLAESLVRLMLLGFGILGLGLVGGWWLASRAVSPIARISRTAQRISANNLVQRVDTETMDAELRSLGESLNAMLDRLENAFRQQVQFTADASHELRTPIAVLRSHCELALNRPRSADEYVRTILTCQHAADRMQSLVTGLLTLARADSGKLVLELREVDLQDLAAETISLFAPYAEEHQVELIQQGTPAVCQADAARIAQVIGNLVDNAIQYDRTGGKAILTTWTEDDWAVLQVADTGPGIPLAAQPHIFDRFYRLDPSRSRAAPEQFVGTGLGLSISKSIIDAHGGTLSLISDGHNGSQFQVRLSRTAA